MAHEFTPDDDFQLITFEEAAKQLRVYEGVDGDGNIIISVPDEKTVIEGNILAAQSVAEAYLERPIESGTLLITLGAFSRTVCFDAWQKPGTVSVSVLPLGGDVRETVPPSLYRMKKAVGTAAGEIIFSEDIAVADVSDAVIITIELKVWESVKQACLLKLAAFYEYREDRPDKGQGIFETLLRPYRKYC